LEIQGQNCHVSSSKAKLFSVFSVCSEKMIKKAQKLHIQQTGLPPQPDNQEQVRKNVL
jgi:hypothetical protein